MNAPSLIVGTTAYNAHVQNMVRALAESGWLHTYVTGGVDNGSRSLSAWTRSAIARVWPSFRRELDRRAVPDIPLDRIQTRWRWEWPRIAASRLGAVRSADSLWEFGELSLDRYCARQLQQTGPTGFLGVEHGALASLLAARELGKTAGLAFLSPHHRTRARWVDGEYERFPRLNTPAGDAVHALAARRDARRDDEARAAEWIVTNSSFTTRSLVDAGVPSGKLLTVPLGGPDPIQPSDLPQTMPDRVRFAYVGPVSVRKGAHYLLRAWRRMAGSRSELHFYGGQLLPADVIDEARAASGGDRITFHGSIPFATLPRVYRDASVLVLPTLCDGFGMVVSEALANGLPVITTANAGAADLIKEGRSGFVIPPADEDALARSLEWCIQHPRELFAMRRAALDAASSWTWLDYRKRLVEVIAQALTPLRVTSAASDRVPVAL